MGHSSYGIGKDAVILNKTMNLKLTCMKPGLCKAGFPIKSVERYIESLNSKGNSYVIYNKDENENLDEIYRYNGEKIYEEANSLDCNKCLNKKDTNEDIIERVRNLGQK